MVPRTKFFARLQKVCTVHAFAPHKLVQKLAPQRRVDQTHDAMVNSILVVFLPSTHEIAHAGLSQSIFPSPFAVSVPHAYVRRLKKYTKRAHRFKPCNLKMRLLGACRNQRKKKALQETKVKCEQLCATPPP